MFPKEFGLISQLVGQQQGQQQQRLKEAQMALQQQQQQQQNGGIQQQQRANRSADSSEGSSEEGSPGQSPTALISNLLGRTSVQQDAMARCQMAQQQANGLAASQLAQSQLANYAGHFPEEMSNLFNASASLSTAPAHLQTASPFGTTYQQQADQQATNSIVAKSSAFNQSGVGTTIVPTGRKHRSSDMVKCHFCPKRLPQASLQAHLEDCRQVRVHECSQCGKRFKARGGLQQHNRIHINDRPYHCHYCPKNFTQKSHVDQHERIHTGAKPFACQYCGRQFRQRSQQMGHEATHVNRIAAASGLEMTTMGGGVGLNRSLVGAGGVNGSANSDVQNSISSEQSSPISELAGGGPVVNGQMAAHFQRQHQRQSSIGCANSASSSASLVIAAAAAHHQMAFNGLLRAVGSGGGALDGAAGGFNRSDCVAVDSLLAMSSMKGQSELDAQLRLANR